MGALLLGFVIASIVGVPFLVQLIFRTRRELNFLRAELLERGVIGPGADSPPTHGAASGERLVGGGSVARPFAPPAPLPTSGTPIAPEGQRERSAPSE